MHMWCRYCTALFQGVGVKFLSCVMFSFFPSVSLFFLMVVLRVLVTVSSRSWMIAWVGIELNMLSFLPLITMGDVGSYHQAEAAGKYFLAQAGGTALFLFSPVV